MALRRTFRLLGSALLAVGFWIPSCAAVDEEKLPDDVPSLIKLLHDKDPQIRGRAAGHLLGLREKAAPAIPDLIVLLADDETAEPMAVANGRVWNAAQWTLSGLGKPAVRPLIDALENPNEKVRERAIVALAFMQPPPKEAIPALVRRLGERNRDIRRNAVDAIGRMGKDAAHVLAAIVDLATNDADEYVRRSAVAAAAMLDGDGKLAVPACLRALKDKSPEVRSQAAQRLGNFGAKADSAVAALTAGLDDQAMRSQWLAPDFGGARAVRYDVAEALGKIGPAAAPALPKLRNMLRSDKDGEVRAIAAQTILRLDPSDKEALPELIGLVKNDQDGTAGPEAALAALESLGPSAVAAMPAIKAALRSASCALRGQAAEALVAVAGKDAVPTLIEQLQWEQRIGNEKRAESVEDDSYDSISVCVRIAHGLGKLGANAAPAVPVLSSLLANPRLFLPYERADVVESLGLVGGAAEVAVPMLIKELDNKDAGLREKTAVALGRIGPAAKAAVSRLLQLADADPDDDVRKAARAAARQIASAVPPTAKPTGSAH
jgi:HEAT repeat protein